MNKDMLDLAAFAIKTAKAAGADGCTAALSAARTVEIAYRERKPETIKEASTRDLQLRLYANGRYSAQGTSDLRPEALKAFIGNAVAMTRLLAEDPFRTLPDPKYYAGRAEVDLAQVDADYAKLTPADRHQWAKAMEAAALKRGGDKVISATAQVQDVRSEDVMLSSNGFEGGSESTAYVAYVQLTAQDAGDRRPMGFSYLVGLNRKDLPAPETVGVQAAERALAMFGGKKVKTETLPIIVENRNGGRLLNALLQAMNGRAVQQKQSFLADKRGQKVGSELLTLVDDPLIPKGLGSRLFDGDGIAARRRTMIDAGVLKEFYVDWYYSRKLGWEPTTAGPSNLIIPPGKRAVAAIMKDLGRGVLITDFIGGNANSTTGDASMGIIGTLFDKGVPAQPVAEMNIAGNTLDLWGRLIEVADDPWPYSSMRLPSLVFSDVVVSGL
jgi:PmbA protein